MTNWGNASKNCASILQDTVEHKRRELVAFWYGCWHFTDLTSQEIAKYVKYCLKLGKALSPDKCPRELLKTLSDH